MVSDGSLQKCCMHAADRFSKSDLPWRSFKSAACHHRRAVGRLSILWDPGAFQHWPHRAAKGDAFLMLSQGEVEGLYIALHLVDKPHSSSGRDGWGIGGWFG